MTNLLQFKQIVILYLSYMLLCQKRIFTKPFQRQTVRKPIVSKAIHIEPVNVIVGMVALTMIVDVGKTFYAQYQRNKNKSE